MSFTLQALATRAAGPISAGASAATAARTTTTGTTTRTTTTRTTAGTTTTGATATLTAARATTITTTATASITATLLALFAHWWNVDGGCRGLVGDPLRLARANQLGDGAPTARCLRFEGGQCAQAVERRHHRIE
jgi:hypothetical protein